MTQKEKQQLHEDVYQYLMNLHHEDESFRFRLRQKNEDRFKQGYWFGGNDTYLETSFWRGSNTKHMTSSLRLVFYFESKEWFFELVGRDESDAKKSYFEKMATELGSFKIHEQYDTIKRQKLLSKDIKDLLSPLKIFINKSKFEIDNYLIHNSLPKEKNKPKKENKITKDDFFDDLEDIQDWTIPSESFKKSIINTNWWQENFKINTSKDVRNDYALSRLYVSKFQGIEELIIEQLPLNTQWIFLTGENGFGKTSILRAIAKGLVGDEDLVAPLLSDTKIYTNGLCNGQPFMYEAKPKMTPNFVIPVATYGVSRFQSSATDQEISDWSKQSTYSLFYDNGKLINIERVLIDSERDDKPTFDKLVAIFKTIIPNLMDIRSELINKKRLIRYYERSDNGKSYEPVLLSELAAGYRSILTMIGDMVIRFSELNNNSVDDLKGIVLIDEIDAHLHPKYQYELPKLLSVAFPKVQFIVTTHSPIPLLSLPKSNRPIVLTVERTLEDGITIDRKDDEIDIYRLNPNLLLTSPIFGFRNILAQDANADEIIAADDYSEVEQINNIRERLKLLREQGLVK